MMYGVKCFSFTIHMFILLLGLEVSNYNVIELQSLSHSEIINLSSLSLGMLLRTYKLKECLIGEAANMK